MLFLRWLISSTFRRARDMHKQVRKAIRAQRDLLSPTEIEALQTAKEELRKAMRRNAPKEELLEAMEHLESVANQNLKPYPHPSIRENVEVVLVAVAVALGVRTFFLQPFKIPTGSMQPTLYGVVVDDLRAHNPGTHSNPDSSIPGSIGRFYESWIYGRSYYHVQAREPGRLEDVDRPKTLFPFVRKQEIQVGAERYTIWFPPDSLGGQARNRGSPWLARAGLDNETYYEKGDDIIKLRVTTGDYLFVDRLSYNFRRPKRGEIIVFETRGIDELPQDQFYIKRLVGLGGETVRIGDDRHLRIDGQRLDASTPGFEKVYEFDPSRPPRESHYSGHVNGTTARKYGRKSKMARLFPNAEATYHIQPRHYMAMGDNTMNSRDSRSWGDFPRRNVIGKFCFVYWPFSERWGP